MIGSVGDDEFGRRAVAELSAAGVDLTRLKVVSTLTGVALITVDAQGENEIVVAPAPISISCPRTSTCPTATAPSASSRSRSRRWPRGDDGAPASSS